MNFGPNNKFKMADNSFVPRNRRASKVTFMEDSEITH